MTKGETKTMTKFLYTGVSVLALMAAASIIPAKAADIYQPAAPVTYKEAPVYAVSNWSGLYLGVNGGYAWDDHARHGGILDNGGFGGGQLGYNWQGVFDRHLVLGFETDIQGTGIDNSAPRGAYEHNIAVDYFGTVRGRIGYAAGNVLFYGTGGYAYGNVKNTLTSAANTYKTDALQGGYAAGGGVEFKLNPAWSLKAEYLYVNLDHTDPVDAAGNSVRTINRQLDTARVGINYHFDRTYEPLK